MEAGFALTIAREDLENISKGLAEIYNRLCIGHCETPNKQMDDAKAYRKRETVADQESREPVNDSFESDSRKENGTDHVTNDRLLNIIRDQLNDLKKAVDRTTELCHRNNLCTGNQDSSSLRMEGNLSFESLLTIRNEQIATLRAVLKANKETAEFDIAKVKSKYEYEKAIMSETMMNLRNELNGCKESFAALRSLFAERCEHFITQLSELQVQLIASEEDIKQLNSHIMEVGFPIAASSPKHGQELEDDE